MPTAADFGINSPSAAAELNAQLTADRPILSTAADSARRRARGAAASLLSRAAGSTRSASAVSLVASDSVFSRSGFDAGRANPLRSRSGRTGSGDFWVSRRTRESLRDYSREIDRNNPEYRRVVNAFVTTAVGSGLTPQADTDDDDYNDRAERLWSMWSSGRCETTGDLSMRTLQRQMLREAVVAGDVLAIHRADGVIQVVESELIGDPSAPDSRQVKDDQGLVVARVTDGVETDARTGRTLAYHIGEYDDRGLVSTSKTTRVRADHAHLLRIPGRFSQTRGVVELAAVLDRVEDISEYISWTIIAGKIAATLAFVVKTVNPGATADQFLEDSDDDDTDALAGIPGSPSRTLRNLGAHRDRQRLAPGEIWYLEPGEEVTSVGSNQPNTVFDPFLRAVLRSIAYGANLPAEVVTFDFKGTNLSSIKAAILLSQEEMESVREIMRRWLSRVWAWKVAGWVRDGLLPYRPDMTRVRWITPSMGWLDPVREVQAEALASDKLLATHRELLASRGIGDVKKHYDQLEREKRWRQERGLAVVQAPGAGASIESGAARDPSNEGNLDAGDPGSGQTR